MTHACSGLEIGATPRGRRNYVKRFNADGGVWTPAPTANRALSGTLLRRSRCLWRVFCATGARRRLRHMNNGFPFDVPRSLASPRLSSRGPSPRPHTKAVTRVVVVVVVRVVVVVVALRRLRRLRSACRWSQVLCKTADMLGFVYFSMVVLLVIMFRQKIRGFAEHFKHVLPAMRGESPAILRRTINSVRDT